MPINDKLNRIKEIKGNIKDAIIEKGVEVTDSDSFNSYADKIREISSGGTPVVPEPEIPVVPQTPWVKPEGWPDIKEGIQDNQIRMLICDMAGRDAFSFNLMGSDSYSAPGECTINWGDGSEPEVLIANSPTHTFNKDNSIKYVDEEGITHNMYIVTVDCRDIVYISFNGISSNMIFWYVDSFTNDYVHDISMSFDGSRYLQCVEYLGEKERKPYSSVSDNIANFMNCISLREFKCNSRVEMKDTSGMFNTCSSLTSLDVSNWDTSKVTSMDSMFSGCSSLTSLDVSKWDTSSVITTYNMFTNCSSLTSLDVSNWDTSKVISMSDMFQNCSSLTSLDTSNWDTSSVTAVYDMFQNCSSLTSLDTSNWDTSKVTNMSNIFSSCSSLTSLDVSNWDTSSVTNTYNMFTNCSSLTSLDVSNWDTSSVTNMPYMFQNCSSLTSLDVSNWDTSKVTNMNGMFQNCSSLTSIDVSNWDIGSVKDMIDMFRDCSSLTSLDVSNWDTSSVTNMPYMFQNCSSLTSIDVSNWDISDSRNMSNIFQDCKSLKEIKPLEWDFSLFTGKGYSTKCKAMFNGSILERLNLTLQNSVDQTSYSYSILDVSSANNMYNFCNFSLTIPRPKFAFTINMSSSSYKNRKLKRLTVRGQDGMTFNASSPQIALDYTSVFKEEQINEFFTNLPTVTNSPTISLKGNPHAQYANMGIALEKGWNVLYDSAAQSASTIPLDGEEKVANLPLVYRFIPGEDGTFVDDNGNKCNLLYTKAVATMNPIGWEMLPTFEDALNKYGIEVEEEYREEIAKDVLAYANDDSLIKRYNIELD